MNDEKKPRFVPTVWQVDAHPTLSLDSSVSAHPSTAMSWVAASETRAKKKRVARGTSPSETALAACGPKPRRSAEVRSCTGTIHDLRGESAKR